MKALLEKYLISNIVDLIFNYAWGNCTNAWQIGFYGNYELATKIKKEDLNTGLIAASGGGFKNIIKLLSNKCIQNNISPSWDIALTTACRNNKKEIAEFIIKKGARFCFQHNRRIDKCLLI